MGDRSCSFPHHVACGMRDAHAQYWWHWPHVGHRMTWGGALCGTKARTKLESGSLISCKRQCLPRVWEREMERLSPLAQLSFMQILLEFMWDMVTWICILELFFTSKSMLLVGFSPSQKGFWSVMQPLRRVHPSQKHRYLSASHLQHLWSHEAHEYTYLVDIWGNTMIINKM